MFNNFMLNALEIAQKAMEKSEIPIGAIIVYNNKIIAKAHNVTLNNPLAHAEMIVIQKSLQILQKRNLSDCSIYVTLEPCPMCYYAISLVKIKNIYFGASAKHIKNTPIANNHNPIIYDKISEQKCIKLLKSFFQQKR